MNETLLKELKSILYAAAAAAIIAFLQTLLSRLSGIHLAPTSSLLNGAAAYLAIRAK